MWSEIYAEICNKSFSKKLQRATLFFCCAIRCKYLQLRTKIPNIGYAFVSHEYGAGSDAN